MASSSRHHRTREDYLKNKELEEQRKAGTVPPQTDEEGNDINPHIPEYVKEAPWYLDSTQPSLKHQKATSFAQSKKQVAKFGEFAARGVAGPAATKYRKGACTNCGAMTHDAKSCLDRPRKQGAKFTGKDIKADEVSGTVEADYEGRHDPYASYDPNSYMEVVEKFDRMERLRREAKAEEEAKKLLEAKEKRDALGAAASSAALAAAGSATGDGDDEFKVDDAQDNVGQFAKTDTKSARSVRDLRIREDTAKYLINRGADAPFYDPKSHSMRANPRPDDDEGGFVGDNASLFTGDTKTFYDMQRFAWETADTTQNATATHVEASPSLAAQQFQDRQKQAKEERERFQREVLATYGGEEHLQAPPVELASASEVYQEYTREGVVVGAGANEVSIPKSRYQEDVFPGNHKSVWGSYYNKGRWGYKCCHQFSKPAYCTGTPIEQQTPASSSKDSASAASASSSSNSMLPPTTTSDSGAISRATENGTDGDHDKSRKSAKSCSSKHSEASSSDSESSSSASSDSEDERRRKKRSSRSKKRSRRARSASSSSSDSSSDSDDASHSKPSKKKIKKYLEEERKAREHTEMDDRKRGYNSNTLDEQGAQIPSAARMEAYHMAKERWDDPMNRIKDKDGML